MLLTEIITYLKSISTMKYIYSFLIILFTTIQVNGQNKPASSTANEEWTIKWNRSDDFNGTEVNRQMWNPNVNHFGIWSWDNDNVTVSNGTAKITMVQETHTRTFWDGCNKTNTPNFELYYKSGILKSYATGTYGYYEASIKGASRYPGVCPSFWIFSNIDNTITEPGEVRYSEVDIVELQQGNTLRHSDHDLHGIVVDENGQGEWLRPGKNPEICANDYTLPFEPDTGFHKYGCEVKPDSIIWYVDGVEIAKKKNIYWHRPMNVTLSMGLRHEFTEWKCNQFYPKKDATTQSGFPTTMEVDYVRVWERANPIAVQGVSFSDNALELNVGESTQMEVNIAPLNAYDKRVTWQSSDSDIISIDKYGVIKAIKSGEVTITATTIDGDFIATKTITAEEVINSTPSSLQKKKVMVYPNPAYDQLNIKGQGSGQHLLNIYNTQGVHFYQQELNLSNKQSVAIQDFPSGIYILDVQGEQINERVMFTKAK